MASPVQISVNQLSRLVGTPAAPMIIDTRIDEDFAEDPRLIPAAIRFPFPRVIDDIERIVATVGCGRVVVYCQKGLKISEGVAALLRAHGAGAEVLQGGHFGWRDAGQIMLGMDSVPGFDATHRSIWVTRVRPKVDRIACAWLIRRFIDANAQFLFVSGSQVEAVAEKFNAIAFDIEGAFFTHRGADCTFDTLLNETGLKNDALARLATIVRGADTDRHELAPQCAGLLAASLGLSRMYSDDLQQLDAGMLIYDAMYRWCRDAIDEKHDWPGNDSGRKSS